MIHELDWSEKEQPGTNGRPYEHYLCSYGYIMCYIDSTMEAVFGTKTNREVLLYLEAYENGYGRAMSQTLKIPLTAIQRQLRRLEQDRVLVSGLVGRTRVYTWNPRNSLVNPLRSLLAEMLKYLPASEKKRLFDERRRPRRSGKAL